MINYNNNANKIDEMNCPILCGNRINRRSDARLLCAVYSHFLFISNQLKSISGLFVAIFLSVASLSLFIRIFVLLCVIPRIIFALILFVPIKFYWPELKNELKLWKNRRKEERDESTIAARPKEFFFSFVFPHFSSMFMFVRWLLVPL